MIGKPYSGELNVRFDEGELEIGHQLLRQFSTLPFNSKRYLSEPVISNIPYFDAVILDASVKYDSHN